MAKSPALAAVLNFFIWGLGYLYLGRKKTFGVLLVLGLLIALLAIGLSPPPPSNIVSDLFLMVAVIIIDIAFALDAYRMAKGTND